MRAKRGIYNVIFGLLYQLVVLIFGLIIPRLMIVNYGSEVNGLLSSVYQIYSYLVLLESGVGMATLQALYRTIAAEDEAATCGVMVATHQFYKRTGFLYLLGVTVLAAVYPLVVKTEISTCTVIAIIMLNGLPGVFNYLFQGKYRILLQAEGKSYILSCLSTVTYLLSNILKIVLINFGYSVVAVQFVYFMLSILPLTFIAVHIRRNYRWLDMSVKPDYKSLTYKNTVLIHQISSLVFSNTDVIILTVVGGLKVVSVYTLFAGLYGSVKSILFSFLDGLKYAMGKMYHKDLDTYYKMHDVFELYYMMLTFAAYTVMHIFILPFIRLYTSEITDINYVDKYIPTLFTAVFLLQAGRGPAGLIIDFAEHFRQTRGRAIAEMSVNIIVSGVCVFKLGIYGVLIGTIVALLYRTNDMIIYANCVLMKRGPWITYRRWLINLALFLAFVKVASLIDMDLSSYMKIVAWGIPSGLVILATFAMISFVSEPTTFRNEFLFAMKRRFRAKGADLT